MREEIQKVKALTDKPFGVPTILSNDLETVPKVVNLLIEEKVPVVLINGLDGYDYRPMLEKFKAHHIKTIFRPHTPTVENARYAQEIGADIFVATGFDEGGMVPDRVIGTFSIVPQMVDAVDIPVMAAGGIADVRGVRAAFALGAEGVFVRSVLLATIENRMHLDVKKMLVESSAQDLILFRTLPAYYRSLPTQLAWQLKALDESGASREALAQAQTGGYGMRLGMLGGDLEKGYISVGNGVTYIHSIRSVKETIDDLMQDFI